MLSSRGDSKTERAREIERIIIMQVWMYRICSVSGLAGFVCK